MEHIDALVLGSGEGANALGQAPKALIDDDDRILGFVAVARHAGEKLPVFQLVMQTKLSFEALESLVIAHPTYAEGVVGMFAGLPER